MAKRHVAQSGARTGQWVSCNAKVQCRNKSLHLSDSSVKSIAAAMFSPVSSLTEADVKTYAQMYPADYKLLAAEFKVTQRRKTKLQVFKEKVANEKRNAEWAAKTLEENRLKKERQERRRREFFEEQRKERLNSQTIPKPNIKPSDRIPVIYNLDEDIPQYQPARGFIKALQGRDKTTLNTIEFSDKPEGIRHITPEPEFIGAVMPKIKTDNIDPLKNPLDTKKYVLKDYHATVYECSNTSCSKTHLNETDISFNGSDLICRECESAPERKSYIMKRQVGDIAQSKATVYRNTWYVISSDPNWTEKTTTKQDKKIVMDTRETAIAKLKEDMYRTQDIHKPQYIYAVKLDPKKELDERVIESERSSNIYSRKFFTETLVKTEETPAELLINTPYDQTPYHGSFSLLSDSNAVIPLSRNVLTPEEIGPVKTRSLYGSHR